MRSHEESNIQRVCVRWFRLQYPHLGKLLFAVPNGGSRNVAEARILQAEGVMRGVADILLLAPSGNAEHNYLCIEMKTEKGRQQETQKEWQEAVEKYGGGKYAICRSLDDFMATINEYLA